MTRHDGASTTVSDLSLTILQHIAHVYTVATTRDTTHQPPLRAPIGFMIRPEATSDSSGSARANRGDAEKLSEVLSQ